MKQRSLGDSPSAVGLAILGGALGGLVSGALFPVGILAGVLASGSTTTLTGKMLNAEHESNHHNQNLSLALKKSPHRCWCLSV